MCVKKQKDKKTDTTLKTSHQYTKCPTVLFFITLSIVGNNRETSVLI